MNPKSFLTGLMAAFVCLSGCVAPQQLTYTDFSERNSLAEINADSLRQVGWQEGLAAANQVGTGGYFASALVGGLPVGFFGAIAVADPGLVGASPVGRPLVWGVALGGAGVIAGTAVRATRLDTVLSVPVEYHVRRQPEAYQRAFRRAYAERVRVRRVRATFLGGLLGAGPALGVLIYFVSRIPDT